MTMKGTNDILKTLELRIEKAKKALAGLDPNGDQQVNRSARKRLKRAQRRYKTWKQLSEVLEKKRQAGGSGSAAKTPAPAPGTAPAVEAKAEPAAEAKTEPAPESKPEPAAPESGDAADSGDKDKKEESAAG